VSAGRDVDVRVSVVPTASGERVVLRLLDRSATRLGLADLGLSADNAARSTACSAGTTASSSSPARPAAARRRRSTPRSSACHTGERNIITIEDPVEYQLRGIGQMQVNPRIDLTFASGLRAVLRQDPDVILVGEIRDRETVEIAMQAALTGHLVFSTLHTNDAPSAVTRLLDMGVEPFLIASSLLGVLAQRLVRRAASAADGGGSGVGSRLTLAGDADATALADVPAPASDRREPTPDPPVRRVRRLRVPRADGHP
jgi:general secretion pathway protein E